MYNLSNLRILYEDEYLIVVFKEAGQLSQKDSSGIDSINEIVREYLKEKYNSSYIALLHRLDRPVAGPLMFAKTKRSADLFSKQFRDGKIFKKYYALVFGKTLKLKKLEHYLMDNEDGVKVSNLNKEGYKLALLEYELINSLKTNSQNIFENYFSLLSVKLLTGRKHQIRVQLAFDGNPIVSDIKYFNINNNFKEGTLKKMADSTFLPRGEFALFCYYLSFNHSLKSGKRVEIILDYPPHWPKNFSPQ